MNIRRSFVRENKKVCSGTIVPVAWRSKPRDLSEAVPICHGSFEVDCYVRARFVTIAKQQHLDRVQRSATRNYTKRPPFSFPLTARLIATRDPCVWLRKNASCSACFPTGSSQCCSHRLGRRILSRNGGPVVMGSNKPRKIKQVDFQRTFINTIRLI